MNRRTLIQASFAGAAILPTTTLAQTGSTQTAGRELVVHSVHEALVHSTPLQIYSGLQSLPVDEPLLIDVMAETPSVEVWDNWNDHDIRQAFGGVVLRDGEDFQGSYLIFDTPDIAYSVHQPVVEEIERGSLDVGGVRASWMDAGGVGFGRMRLWNVLITGAGASDQETEDVMLGMIRHLGRAIGLQI